MQFVAHARFIRYSPYKLRPLADVIRGKNAQYALDWLTVNETRRTLSLKKVLQSAIANAKDLEDARSTDLVVREIRVDQGPIIKYFKPGAMGRANIQRKRFSHISITLEELT